CARPRRWTRARWPGWPRCARAGSSWRCRPTPARTWSTTSRRARRSASTSRSGSTPRPARARGARTSTACWPPSGWARASSWPWVTPNLLTTLANLAKLAGAALILPDRHGPTIAAVVLLQFGLLFDHLDGTLARYRRTGTAFGAFYDKLSDAITWLPICLAIG